MAKPEKHLDVNRVRSDADALRKHRKFRCLICGDGSPIAIAWQDFLMRVPLNGPEPTLCLARYIMDQISGAVSW